MNPCPVAIKQYFITNLSVKANPQAQPGIEGQANIDAQATSARNSDNKKLWRVGLDVTCTPVPGSIIPYFVQVEAVGFFEIEDSVAEENAEALISNLGPSMLYGAIRELVVLVTGRGPNPALVLPTFTFIKENAASAVRYDTPDPSNRISSHLSGKK